jgi:MOSC domain-containing protein YiiM
MARDNGADIHLQDAGTEPASRVGPERPGYGQSDLSVHCGPDKAVYVYPAEYYPFWSKELLGVEFPWGAFGEDFTSDGLVDGAVHIGDRLRIGTVEFMVTQLRMPATS